MIDNKLNNNNVETLTETDTLLLRKLLVRYNELISEAAKLGVAAQEVLKFGQDYLSEIYQLNPGDEIDESTGIISRGKNILRAVEPENG